MLATAFQAVERFEELEIAPLFCKGPSGGWFDVVFFIVRQYSLAKCLAYVPCFGDAFEPCGKEEQGAVFQLGKYGGKTVLFAPVVWIKVPERHDPIFASVWFTFSIVFDCGDCHCG